MNKFWGFERGKLVEYLVIKIDIDVILQSWQKIEGSKCEIIGIGILSVEIVIKQINI